MSSNAYGMILCPIKVHYSNRELAILCVFVQNPLEEDWEEDEKRLHEEFLNLLTSMEAYLAPLTQHMESVLR